MRFLYIYVAYACVLLHSCSNSVGIFKNIETPIVCEKVDVNFIIALNIELLTFDSLLIFNDFKLNPMLSVLKLNNNELLSQFIDKGVGPNECIPPIQLQRLKDSIYLFERQTSTLYRFGKSLLYGKNINKEKIWQSNRMLNTFIPLNDTMYISTGITNDARYSLIDKHGVVVKNFGEFPDLMPEEKEYSIEGKNMYHQTFFLKYGDHSVFAAISPHVLELYSYNDVYDFTLNRKVQFSKYKYTHSEGNVLYVTSSRDTPRGSMCCYCTGNYIYIVYNSENEKSSLNPDKRNNYIGSRLVKLL